MEEQKQEIKFFTKTGDDIWKIEGVSVVLRNMETGRTVTVEKGDKEYFPIFMPVIEKPEAKTKNKKTKIAKARKGNKSKYKGVKQAASGKFRAQYWDNKKKKVTGLGTFDDELLAAAAVQKALGNYGAAHRLMEEYQEGDGTPPPKTERTDFSEL